MTHRLPRFMSFTAPVLTAAGLALALANTGCSKSATPEAPAASAKAAALTAAPSASSAPAPTPAAASSKAADAATAEVGKAAPDFDLKDLEGKSVKLSDLKGKLVVLEWFNPECPFVKKAHTVGSLKDAAKKQAGAGVVWLAINSSAPGKQGHGAAVLKAGAEKFGMTHPILVDETGKVGHLYGAERTPHLFVIDKEGKLAYAGAIDNSPDGERASPEGGKLVDYVSDALEALKAGKPVPQPRTKAYGCGVKYGS